MWAKCGRWRVRRQTLHHPATRMMRARYRGRRRLTLLSVRYHRAVGKVPHPVALQHRRPPHDLPLVHRQWRRQCHCGQLTMTTPLVLELAGLKHALSHQRQSVSLLQCHLVGGPMPGMRLPRPAMRRYLATVPRQQRSSHQDACQQWRARRECRRQRQTASLDWHHDRLTWHRMVGPLPPVPLPW